MKAIYDEYEDMEGRYFVFLMCFIRFSGDYTRLRFEISPRLPVSHVAAYVSQAGWKTTGRQGGMVYTTPHRAGRRED